MKKILLTGDAEYIGTHVLVELDKVGFQFIVYDNLSNASKKALNHVEILIGKKITFIEGDIRNKMKLKKVFHNYTINSVIHFAELKAVGEFVKKPLSYYDNIDTINLLDIMQEFNCKEIVFSSPTTIYGDSASVPITEDFPTFTTNPYGQNKLIIEEILQDLFLGGNRWKIIILRYSNPVDVHESDTMGEDPNDIPNNLMPYILQVAVGNLPHLNIFGNDYHTVDDTGVRDYIHVVNLAYGHIKALKTIERINKVEKVNLGIGQSYSVLDMVKAFEKANGKTKSYDIAPRRARDIAECYADPTYAKLLS